MVNIGSLCTGGNVVGVKADLARIALTNCVCTQIGEKLALSRRIDNHWRSVFAPPPLAPFPFLFFWTRNLHRTAYITYSYVEYKLPLPLS